MGVKKTDGVNYDLQGKSVVPLAKKSHRLLEMGFFNLCFGTVVGEVVFLRSLGKDHVHCNT